jgi:hypothetical protein
MNISGFNLNLLFVTIFNLIINQPPNLFIVSLGIIYYIKKLLPEILSN